MAARVMVEPRLQNVGSFCLVYAEGVKATLSLLTMLLVTASTANSAEIVTDEATRMGVLRLVFPNARISAVSGPPNIESFSVTDPLGHLVISLRSGFQHEYAVVGPVAKEEEEPASDITRFPEHWMSDKRRVLMEVFRWKPPRDGEPLLVAVLSYSFPTANPARCCRAKGKVILLSTAADRILDRIEKVPYAFTTFTSVRFLDMDGSGAEKLMIGADTSGMGSIGVDSAVFDLSNRKLDPLLAVNTLVFYEADIEDLDIHTLTLDEPQTIRSSGKRFFFVKKTFAEKAKLFAKPPTSQMSYPVGFGVPLDWQ
jgi:hypothetical protein